MAPLDWNAYVESLLARDGEAGTGLSYGPRAYRPAPPRPEEPEEPGTIGKIYGGLTDALGWAKEKVDVASNYYSNPTLRNRVLSGEPPIPSEVLMKEALIAPPDPTMSKTEQYSRSIGRGLTQGVTRILTDPVAMTLMRGIGPRALRKPMHLGFMGMMGHGMYEGGKRAYETYREEGMTPGVAEELAQVGVDAGFLASPLALRLARGRGARPGAPAEAAEAAPRPRAEETGFRMMPEETGFRMMPERGGAMVPAGPRGIAPPLGADLVPRGRRPPPWVVDLGPRPAPRLPASGEGLPVPARATRANLSNVPERANIAAHESIIRDVDNRLRVAVEEGNNHEAAKLIKLKEGLRESAWQSQPGDAARLREPYEAPGVVHEVVQQPQNRPRMLRIREELQTYLDETGDPTSRAKIRTAMATLDAQLRQNPLPALPEPPPQPAPGAGPPPGAPPGAPGAPAAPPGAPAPPGAGRPVPGPPMEAPGLPGVAPETRIAPSAATMAGGPAEAGFRADAGIAAQRQPTADLVAQAQARVAGLPETPAMLPADVGPAAPLAVEGRARDTGTRAAAPPVPVVPAVAPPPPAAPTPALPTPPRPVGAPVEAARPRPMPTEALGEAPKGVEWGSVKDAVRAAEEAGAPIKEAAARIAGAYPEEIRPNIERQADMLLQNRDIGREYLETLAMEDGFRQQVAEKPTKMLKDPKTGAEVEFHQTRGKNGDYLLRDPAGEIVAGARVMNGTYSMIVGGDRIMDMLPEGPGIIYRVTKGQKVGSSKAVTPAGSAAQARAAARGLDVRGGVAEVVLGGAYVEGARAAGPGPAEGPVRAVGVEREPGPRPARDVREPGRGARPEKSRADARLGREAAERRRTLAILADAPGGRVTSADLISEGLTKRQAVQMTRALEREGILKWSRQREDYALTKKGRNVVAEEMALVEEAPPPEPVPEVAVEVPSKPVRAVEAGGQELVPGFVEAAMRTPEITEGRVPGEMFTPEAEAVRGRKGPPPKAPEQVEIPSEPARGMAAIKQRQELLAGMEGRGVQALSNRIAKLMDVSRAKRPAELDAIEARLRELAPEGRQAEVDAVMAGLRERYAPEAVDVARAKDVALALAEEPRKVSRAEAEALVRDAGLPVGDVPLARLFREQKARLTRKEFTAPKTGRKYVRYVDETGEVIGGRGQATRISTQDLAREIDRATGLEPVPEPGVPFRPKKLTAKALATKAPGGKLIAGDVKGEAWHGTPDVLIRAKAPRVGAKLLEAGKGEEIARTVDRAAKAARSKAEIVEAQGENALVRLADGTEVLVDGAALAHAAKTKGALTWFGKAEDPGAALVAYRGDLSRPGKAPYAVVKTKGAPEGTMVFEEAAPKQWVDRETNEAMVGLENAIRRVDESGNLKTWAQEQASKRKGYERPDLIEEFLEGREIDPSMEYVLNQSKMKRARTRLRERVEGEWQDEMARSLEEVPREGPGFDAYADAAEGRIGDFRASERGAVDVDLLLWPGRLVKDAAVVGARVLGKGFDSFGTWAAQMGRVLGGGLKGLRRLWDMVTANFGPGRPRPEPVVPPRPGPGAPRPPVEVPGAAPPTPRGPRETPTSRTKVVTPDIGEAVRASRFEGPLRKGEKPAATDFPVNTETLNTRADVASFEHRMAEAMKATLDKNREYRSWEEARKAALDAGLSEADVKRLIKERGVLRDSEILAGERLRSEFGGDAKAKYDALQALKESKSARPEELALAEEELIAAVARWGEITAHTTASKAELGRGLGILRKVKSELSPEERLYQQAVKYGMTKGVDAKLMNELGQAVLAKDHAALTRLARQVMKPGMIDKVNEFFVNNILSGPPTPAANVAGNWIHQVLLRTPERYVSGVLEGAAAKKAGRLPERLPGEAFEAMKAHWKTGFGFSGRWTKILRDTMKENPWDPEAGILKGEFRPPAIGGTLGKVWRTPSRLMRTLDNAARSAEYEAQLAGEIYRDGFNGARQRGLTGAGLEGFMEQNSAKLIKDMTRWREIDVKQRIHGMKDLTPQEKAIYNDTKLNRFGQSAERAARESTFQDAPGAFARAALRLRQTHPWMTLFIPFISTPSRILSQAVARTPFGLVRAAKRAAKGETTGGVAADELAKGIWGSFLSAGMYGLAESGLITGSGPTDVKERSILRETGWEPYSVKIGDTYVSMARLEPLATVLGLSADLAETRNAKKAGDLADKLVATLTNNIMSKTYLEGVSSLIEALEDPERYGSTYAKKFIGAVAVPNIVAVAARATDPYVRDTGPMEGAPPGLGYVAPPILSRIPGVSRTLPKRMRGTGEPIVRREHPISRAVSPIRYSRAREGKELEKLMLDIGYIPSRAPKSVTIPGTGGRKALLSQKDKDLYARYMRRATDAARRMVQQPGFARADPMLQEKTLKRIFREARDAARRQVLPSVARRARFVE